MPHYFFDLYNVTITLDEEGAELESVAAARARAIDYAQGMAAAAILKGGLDLTHFIKVRDESGRSLFAVRFDEVVNVENRTRRGTDAAAKLARVTAVVARAQSTRADYRSSFIVAAVLLAEMLMTYRISPA